ncbi:bifunctional DNA primase/polymerase [Streptomyces sp. NPDC092296]|uniref:bifunctional DNA primase/polymerase n=1 Tax=Streptomyces sp. NPDC092296 TaxID=3366012 RepID=UPI0037FF68E9
MSAFPDPALTAAALACAERGWPVLPLLPGAKRPALHGETHCPRTGSCATGHTKWEQRATTDPARIERCWAHAPYNVGVATGPAGLLVIDLDTPKDKSKGSADMPCGMTYFQALCERAGQPLPATRTVRTAGGGWHLYFTAPPGAALGNTAGRLGRLIDTRAAGGYVVAPASTVAGRTYTLTHDTDPAPLPAWLTAALAPVPRPAGPPAAAAVPRNATAYAAAALRNETANVATAQQGGRNAALLRAARALGRLVASGDLPRHTVEEALREAGEACGLVPGYCTSVITSALNWSITHNPGRAA